MDFFHKGGKGGSKAFQKFWGTFWAPTVLGRKGGGVDQIQKFLGTFYQIFGELGHKKVPKKCHKIGL